MRIDFDRARDFVLRHARLIDRHRFAFRFESGPADAVVFALRPYQNADGGFGHALEPDLRCAASQPVPAEHALQILDEVDEFDPEIVLRCCDWLSTVTTEEGGVPFVLGSVAEGPHAPWWKGTGDADFNPTAGIVGLLHKHAVKHPWVTVATAYCWRRLEGGALGKVGPDDAICILQFLEWTPERERAGAAFDELGEIVRSKLVANDPQATGYVKMPLEFAPDPGRMARRLFDAATMENHLDALAARQQDDGGWPITWEPPSAAARSEWRAYMTIKWLDVLDNYSRLD